MADPWREGKYVDLWSIVHVHGGFLLAWTLLAFGLPLLLATALAVVGLVLYEVAEEVTGVGEHATNRIADVGFGLAGIALAHPARAAGLGSGLVIGVAVSFTLLGLWGWWAWWRRERA